MAYQKEKAKKSRVIRLLGIAAAAAASIALVWLTVDQVNRVLHSDTREETQQTEPTLPPNPYSEADFTEENGFLRYTGSAKCRSGIDVSYHQGDIDWEAVASDNIEFAIVRLGFRDYADGNIHADDCFSQNVIGAHGVGIETGAYFFSQATTVEEAKEEAEYVCKTLKPYDMTCPIAFDWEPIDGSRSDGVSYETVCECAAAFCKIVEENGYTAAIYFNHAMANYLNLVKLDAYEFWLAEYNSYPTYAYAFDLWQYSCTGTVSGITGNVDLDLFFG